MKDDQAAREALTILRSDTLPRVYDKDSQALSALVELFKRATDFTYIETPKGAEYEVWIGEQRISLGTDILSFPKVQRAVLVGCRYYIPSSASASPKWYMVGVLPLLFDLFSERVPDDGIDDRKRWLYELISTWLGHRTSRAVREPATADELLAVIEEIKGGTMDPIEMPKAIRYGGRWHVRFVPMARDFHSQFSVSEDDLSAALKAVGTEYNNVRLAARIGDSTASLAVWRLPADFEPWAAL